MSDLVVGGGDRADHHLLRQSRAGAGEFSAVRGVVLHPSGGVGTVAPVAWKYSLIIILELQPVINITDIFTYVSDW